MSIELSEFLCWLSGAIIGLGCFGIAKWSTVWEWHDNSFALLEYFLPKRTFITIFSLLTACFFNWSFYSYLFNVFTCNLGISYQACRLRDCMSQQVFYSSGVFWYTGVFTNPVLQYPNILNIHACMHPKYTYTCILYNPSRFSKSRELLRIGLLQYKDFNYQSREFELTKILKISYALHDFPDNSPNSKKRQVMRSNVEIFGLYAQTGINIFKNET